MRESAARCCVDMARYMVESGDTVRGAAQRFGVSKSLTHRELTLRLKRLDPLLYEQARALMEYHKAVRHLRGGEATRRRFLSEKREKVGRDTQK